MSMFDTDNLMNEEDKPKLKHALSKLLPKIIHVIPPNSKTVSRFMMMGYFCINYHGPLVMHLSKYVKHM